MARKPQRPERNDERLARHVVAACLDAPCERLDDGSANAMPDGVIVYPDGRRGFVEVVGDRDENFEKQWTALQNGSTWDDVAGTLRWGWRISLEHSTQLKGLRRSLIDALVAAEDGASSAREATVAFARQVGRGGRGVYLAQAVEESPAVVRLSAAPFAGFGGDVEEVPGWAEGILARHDDVARKLAAYSTGEEELHAYIWSSISSTLMLSGALDGTRTDLPTRAPELPAGVTHVWVMSGFTAARGLAWFPDRGWHQVPYRFSGEPIVLDN